MRQDILTIGVAGLSEVKARMKAALHGQRDATARFTFASGEDLPRPPSTPIAGACCRP